MNILITGASGFIGSNLMTLLSDLPDAKLFAGNRQSIDLYSSDNIESFLNQNNINCVIHCAKEGGSRLKTDESDVFYKNLLMFENLMKFSERYDCFINFASGAEFDKKYDINSAWECEVYDCVPVDYYGLSKNIITKRLSNLSNAINLRIFACFYHNELPTRFIHNNLINYINKRPMIIHKNRYMDFFYMEDLAIVVKHFLTNITNRYTCINMSYEKKYSLVDIVNIINNLSDYKVDTIVESSDVDKCYTGDSTLINNLHLPLKKLETGIVGCYNRLK